MKQSGARRTGGEAEAGNGLATLRGRLFQDPELAARLAAIEQPEPFIAAVVELAGNEGIRLAPSEIADALRPDPLGIGRFGPAPVTLDRWPAPGWAPARSSPTGGAPALDWIWFGEEGLRGAFYEDAVRRCWSRPLNLLSRGRTSFAALLADRAAQFLPAPDGFIFHMSRCGSTLLAQMLGRLPGQAVLSEPEPVDAIVQWASLAAAPAQAAAALGAVVRALGRGHAGAGRRLFIKLDAWHSLALPLFREAFPEVPWIFLYREPLAVMASQMRVPGVHVVPGVLPGDLLGIGSGEPIGLEEYCARALAQICRAAIDHWPLGGGLLVNYSELRAGVPPGVAAHFGLAPTPAESEIMVSAAEHHSKTGAPFSPDSAGQEQRSAVLERAVERHLRGLFEQLEALRLG